jgi:hypothetical protein
MRATEITEALGMYDRLKDKVKSSFGSPMAKGRLEADDMARHMINLYTQYLGSSNEKATRDGLLKWLQSKKYPTEKAEQVVPGTPSGSTPPPSLNTKQVNDMLTAAANEFVSSGYKLVSPAAPPAPPTSTPASWTPKVIKAAKMFNVMPSAEQNFFKSLFGTARPSGTSTIAGMTPNILKLITVYRGMEEQDRKFFNSLIGLT